MQNVGGSQGISRFTNGLRNLASGNVRGAIQAATGQDGRGPKESAGPGTVKDPSQVLRLRGLFLFLPAFLLRCRQKRDEGINKNELKTFGYPVSDTQFQLIQRYNQNIMLEQIVQSGKI